MASGQSDPQHNPSSGGSKSGSPTTQTGVIMAEYACPECGEVILRIEGDSLRYASNHFHASGQHDEHGFVALKVSHAGSGSPGEIIFPPNDVMGPRGAQSAFFTLRSLMVRSK
jgi:cytochrome c551/c552